VCAHVLSQSGPLWGSLNTSSINRAAAVTSGHDSEESDDGDHEIRAPTKLLHSQRPISLIPSRICSTNTEYCCGRARYIFVHNVQSPTKCVSSTAILLFLSIVVLMVAEIAGKIVIALGCMCRSTSSTRTDACIVSSTFVTYLLVFPTLPILEPFMTFTAIIIRRPFVLRIASVVAVLSSVNLIALIIAHVFEDAPDLGFGNSSVNPFNTCA